ncbi:MAG: TetR/AcrR family transcriptional regulator [Rhodanobacteraceae bacterium]
MNHAATTAVPTRATGPGRPKDMEKRTAILEAAKRLFPLHGYEGTSMDTVAAEACVSKLTVYSHFGDKDSLFREALRERCRQMLPDRVFEDATHASLREGLFAIARAHARAITDPEAIGTWRAILGDCRQGNPRLGQLMWEEGPGRLRAMMEHFLALAVKRSDLDIADVGRAAGQFLALLKGDLHAMRLFGCTQCPERFEQEVQATAEAAVEMFLRAYARRSSG